jgi:hypothetical protein
MIAASRLAIALTATSALACSAPSTPDRDQGQSNLTVNGPTMPALPPMPPPAAAPRVIPPGHREALRTTIRQLDARLGLAPYLALDVAAVEARAQALLETG